MAEEEAAFRERAAARAAASAAAEESDSPVDAADAATDGADAAPSADGDPAESGDEDASAPRTLHVTPKATLRIPEGYSTDPVMVDTPSGVSLRFRTLLPLPDVSR